MRHHVRELLLLVLAIISAAAVRSDDSLVQVESLVSDSVLNAEKRFFVTWDSAWRASEKQRHQLDLTPDYTRSFLAHCHREVNYLHPYYAEPLRGAPSQFGDFRACTSWLQLAPTVKVEDEWEGIDNALTAKYEPRVKLARDSLLRILSRAVDAHPSDDLIFGQLVRMLIDQGRSDSALIRTQSCTASAWWCLMLQGYVRARTNRLVLADSIFRVALAKMPTKERCTWEDVSVLLNGDEADRYKKMDCASREAFNQRLWWLSDPLLIGPGNERRAEHYVRKTALALRAELPRGEKYDWRDSMGGDGRRAAVIRYGWPTYTYWFGPETDNQHFEAHVQKRGGKNAAPYTTYEYSLGRIHMVPAGEALENPFRSQGNAWQLADTAPSFTRTNPERGWWPIEHFKSPFPIVQLPNPQVAMFRREEEVLLAVSTELSAQQLDRPMTTSVPNVMLAVSAHPDAVQVVATKAGVVGVAVPMWALIPPEPALIGLEFSHSGSKPAGRTRFGVEPPLTLSRMAPAEVGISSPMILQATSSDEDQPFQPDSALGRMAGSLNVQQVGRIGVYWETYGVSPADSVELAIWLERYTPQGIARRFTNRLGITKDANTPVAISWVEGPDTPRRSVIPGRIPVIGRSVSIDVGSIAPGDYWLDVAVRAPGGTPTRSRTHLTVR